MDMQEPTFSIRDLESRLARLGVVVPSGALPFMFGNTIRLQSTGDDEGNIDQLFVTN